MRSLGRWMVPVLITVLALPLLAQQATRKGGVYDQQIQQEVTKYLQGNKKFKDVNATVDDGIVKLTGSVNLYADKAQLFKKIRGKDHVAGVRNDVQVAGPNVPDVQLRSKLADKLRYDRIDQGIMFNNLTIGVKDGTATVGGTVRTDIDKDSALSAVADTPGVKDVVDRIKVAPVSGFDDDLRIDVARAVYGKLPPEYLSDPQAPIRIVVQNGKVDLYGVVDSQLDRQIAMSQARSVPGVFSVTDHLVVANESKTASK